MTRHFILIFVAAAAPATLFAQSNSFQQPGWIAAPGGSRITYATLQPDGQSGTVTGHPFSAIEARHSIQTLSDGTHVDDSSTSAFYRDNEGRMRSESKTQAIIYDPVADFIYTLNLSSSRYVKNPLQRNATYSIATIGNRTSISSHASTGNSSSSQFGADQAAPGKTAHRELVNGIHSRAVTENLPSQVVNGVICRGSRVTETIPAGTFGNDRDIKIVSERWFSDDLQVLVKTTNSDPRFGVNTYELTNIVQAPPDAALFRVPAGFTETGPEFRLRMGAPNQGK